MILYLADLGKNFDPPGFRPYRSPMNDMTCQGWQLLGWSRPHGLINSIDKVMGGGGGGGLK